MSYKYILSIRLMTYNHEKFIKDAIEGILIQKTNFNIEVVVGDDFSKDETLNLIKKYKNSKNIHFNILDRPLGGTYSLTRRKLGRLYNFKNILENCQGKYIALLDGDDYWTDPLKLQKQVDFLEHNDNYELVTHKHDRLKDGIIIKNEKIYKENLTTSDLARAINFITLSAVFRTDNLKKYIDEFVLTIPYTHFLFYYLSQFGKVKLINESMGVYRIHDGGVWSKIKEEDKYIMSTSVLIKTIDYFSRKKVKKILINRYIFSTLNMVLYFIKKKEISKCFIYLRKSFKYGTGKGHFKFLYVRLKMSLSTVKL